MENFRTSLKTRERCIDCVVEQYYLSISSAHRRTVAALLRERIWKTTNGFTLDALHINNSFYLFYQLCLSITSVGNVALHAAKAMYSSEFWKVFSGLQIYRKCIFDNLFNQVQKSVRVFDQNSKALVFDRVKITRKKKMNYQNRKL